MLSYVKIDMSSCFSLGNGIDDFIAMLCFFLYSFLFLNDNMCIHMIE